jgi:hypothetical protein
MVTGSGETRGPWRDMKTGAGAWKIKIIGMSSNFNEVPNSHLGLFNGGVAGSITDRIPNSHLGPYLIQPCYLGGVHGLARKDGRVCRLA